MKRTRAVVIIIILIVAVISVGFVLQFIRSPFAQDPIEINSNEDFEEQGWPGSGIESDPYVISGLMISQGYLVWEGNTQYTILTDAAVMISDTTAHFVITRCAFGGDGVILSNVENGIIEFCNSGSPTGTGGSHFVINGSNLRNCTIRNNLFGNVFDYCIQIENGSSNTISGNTIFYDIPDSSSRPETGIYLSGQTLLNCRSNIISNYDIGIELRDCSGGWYNHWVSNNFIEECGTGLSLRSCSNLPVYLNELYNNTRGLEAGSSIGVIFGNNTVSYNSDGGVWVTWHCIDFVVYNNVITNNGWAGITFEWMEETTHPCQALNNSIRNNDGWGIIINGINNPILTDNILIGNSLGDIGYNISSSPSLLLAAHNLQPRIILNHDHVKVECMSLLEKRN